MTTRWKDALRSRSFAWMLCFSLGGLAVLAWVIGDVFVYVQQTPGRQLSDPLLDLLPSYDLSLTIFTLIYGSLLLASIDLLASPGQFLRAVLAYVLLVCFRIATMNLFPLEPHPSIVPLNDPLVDYFFYDEQIITKDLMFSGHVSLLALLALSVQRRYIKMILATLTILVAMLLLIQHAHYTIDVMAAPFFSFLSYGLSRRMAPASRWP